MNIGLAYDMARFEEKALLQAARRLGHTVSLIHVPNKEFWVTKPDSMSYDFIFQRCVSYYRAVSSTIVFERNNIPVVNSLNVIRDCEDKLLTTARLSAAGVDVPDTAVAFRREPALNASRRLGYPVVVKPIYGSWGRMIARAPDEETLQDIIELRENMQSPYIKIHYLQRYVDKPGRDIRAYYVWGDVPVAIYRVSGNWKTNTALGGKAEPAPITDELREIVIKSGEALGGGVLGIDLMESPDGRLLVSEINAIVEFRNTVRATGYDLAGKIVEETVRVMRR